MYCPNCGKEIDTEDKFCRECGLSLTEEFSKASLEIPASTSDTRKDADYLLEVAKHHKSTFLAAFLSFVLPGLGLIYLGNTSTGLIFIILYCVGLPVSFMVMAIYPVAGLIILLAVVIFYIWQIAHAHKTAKKYNEYLIQNGRTMY